MQTNNNINLSASLAAIRTLVDIIRPWFIAACLLITAILLLPNISQLSESYQILLRYLPYGLAALVILLGHQFVQGRISFAAINLLVGYAIIQTQLQAPLEQDAVRTTYTLLSIYWPANFFIIYWLPERKLTSATGFALISLLAFEIFTGYLLISLIADSPQTLSQYFTLQPFVQESEHIMKQWLMPVVSSVLLAITSLVLFIHSFIKRDRSHSVLLACMITSALVCGWFDQSGISSLFSSLMASALIIALLFNSHDLAFLDELTSLPGRRALMNELKHCGKHYCVVMADIDHFKQFNDTHGHDTGDDVLRIVAQELAKVRGGGKAFRYGGEEFTLLFKRKTIADAMPYIEKIRQNIADYPLIIRDKQTRPKALGKKKRIKNISATQVQVTVSFGMAQRQTEQRAENVMKAADQALYRAKENGRNCLSE